MKITHALYGFYFPYVGLKRLVKHCTGSLVAMKNSIEVAFESDSDGIRVSTCLRKITLPRIGFVDYNSFNNAMDAVVPGSDFTLV